MKKLLVLSLCFLASDLQAKNVILFLGDGMGISTVTAARIYVGQKMGKSGEEHELSFDKFSNVALAKTYNTDAQVPDSAGTITAILAGQKTRMGVLGVGPEVPHNDCAMALKYEIPSLLELAEVQGKKTGIVSTARITHATPAGAYSHVPNRNWEDDSKLTNEARSNGCEDIAQQLINFEFGDGPDVILGGGRAHFLPQTQTDPEYAAKKGLRLDDQNLIETWIKGRPNREFVWNSAQFSALDPTRKGQLLGLFEPSHMQFEADRASDGKGEPSLQAMTRMAIAKLSQSDEGYFLLVEAGRIDHGHHFGNAYRALEDTHALDIAVAAAVELSDPQETLIVVTADHSHTLTISGYPKRGNPILGKVAPPDNRFLAGQETPAYTTLSYANGPGYFAEYPDLTDVDTTNKDYQQIASVPLPVETHAGEDVAIFAEGLGADNIRGVMEQNRIFHAMHKALFGTGEQ
jgi:alkaline phosphatase